MFNFPAKFLPNGCYEVTPDVDLTEDSKLKVKECVDVRIFDVCDH